LVTVAVLLVVLLGFVALAVDVGVLYGSRTQSQAAADAAALAGAVTYVLNPLAPQPDTAQSEATKVAIVNKVMGTGITAGEVNAIASEDPVTHNKRVTVTINRTQPTFFAKVLNIASVNVGVQAIAEASPNASGGTVPNNKPWFIPNTMFAPDNACTACMKGDVLISGGQPTAFAQSKLGTQFVVKPDDPKDAIAPSQFYAIQMGGPGASDYRDAISGRGPANDVTCLNSYQVKTGNMVGPTEQGTHDLIGNPPVDSYFGLARYGPSMSLIRDTSQALVTAPLVDLCSYPGFCPSNKLPSGSGVMLQVVGFALIFIEDVNKTTGVTGRLINVSSCDSVGPAISGGTAGAGIPLRLVHLP
jgi:hypothetical protein